MAELREGGWSQLAYIKGSFVDEYDAFGFSVALSADGTTLAVGAQGDQIDFAVDYGSAYVFARDDMGGWSEQACLVASNGSALSAGAVYLF